MSTVSWPAALVFDFDGLILDTETPEFEGWQALYTEYGQHLSLQAWGQAIGTSGGFDPIKDLEELTDQRLDGARLRAEQHARVIEQVRRQDALPGVRGLLDQAQELGIACAVASSSEREWVHGWLLHLGLLERFALTRCRDDVKRVKPAPDLYAAAVLGLGVAPEAALALEDSPNGARGAVAAGVPVLVVKNPLTAQLTFPAGLRTAASLADVNLRSWAAEPIRPLEPRA